jgi:hypothetical protein
MSWTKRWDKHIENLGRNLVDLSRAAANREAYLKWQMPPAAPYPSHANYLK